MLSLSDNSISDKPIFHKKASFEAGNYVSDSSFKWRKIDTKMQQQVKYSSQIDMLQFHFEPYIFSYILWLEFKKPFKKC